MILICTLAHSRVCPPPVPALSHLYTLIEAWTHTDTIQEACTHTHIHMHRSMHVYTHRNMQAYSQKHAYIYTPRSIYTCTHTHRSMDTDHAPQEVCTYTHMHEFTEAGARACAQTQIQAVMHIHNQHLHTQGPLYLHRPPPLDSKYTLTQSHTCIV